MFNKSEIYERDGFLIILSAPSGAGKTTIYKHLLEKHDAIEYSISTTTRQIRGHEVDGEDYNFVNREEFENAIKEGRFAEWAEVHGNYYGTSKKVVDDALQNKKILIFDIDVQGAMQLKEVYENKAILVFIITPSYEELKNRLSSRSTDSDEAIRLRLKNAVWEFGFIDKYDYIVVNDQIDDAIEDVERIIRAEALKIGRINNIKWKGLDEC